MIDKRAASILACLTLFLLTGCWDRRELNDRLFDLGAGIDQQKDGTYLLSAQFMIPAKSGESGTGANQSFFIETSKGKNVFDGILKMQTKLSRKVTRGHRRNLFIGEPLAKESFTHILDSFTRDPDSRIRTDIWVVKGDTALNLLKVPYPLEKLPAMAALKMRQAIGSKVGSSFLDYLISASEEGSTPSLPAVEIENNSDLGKKTIKFTGRALFNHMHKLVGYFNLNESGYSLWVRGELSNAPVTFEMPDENSTVSCDITQLKRKIYTFVDSGEKVRIGVELTGQAVLRENNTSMDLSDISNLNKLEEALKNHIEKEVLLIIEKAQKQFKSDVFGFGEVIGRQHPTEWKSLKKDWEKLFPVTRITVSAQISIKKIGLQGPPIKKPK